MSRTVFIPDSQSWISTEAIKKCTQFGPKLIFRGKQLVWQVENKPFRLFPFMQTRRQEITKSTLHFQKREPSNPHLSPSASPLKWYKQPSRLPSINLLIQKGLALMGQVSKLSHALVWLKTTHSSTKLTFFQVPGIPLCFACEVKHPRAICGWQMCCPMILLIKQFM